MSSHNSRMRRESKTLEAMIRLYCHDHHGSKDKLCPECRELWDYALARLDRCPFHENKPTCAKCPVHCYQPEMREKVRVVMRYAGPRMLRRHPVLAVLHLIDGFRRTPDSPRR